MAETAALLADEVLPERPMRQWVLSLPYALWFLLATYPDSLTRVLGTAFRAICRFLLKKAGRTRASGHCGAVTLIQRFGSALNLNIHSRMIFLDGVYLPVAGAPPLFREVPGPTAAQLQALVQQIAERIGKALERRGLVECDLEIAWLSADSAGAPDKRISPRHLAMSWAQRLKRVFGIEIEACARCGGKLKILTNIDEPEIIAKILAHVQKMAPQQYLSELPLGARAPPLQVRLI